MKWTNVVETKRRLSFLDPSISLLENNLTK